MGLGLTYSCHVEKDMKESAAVDKKQVTKRKGPKYDASKYIVKIEHDLKPPTPKTEKN